MTALAFIGGLIVGAVVGVVAVLVWGIRALEAWEDRQTRTFKWYATPAEIARARERIALRQRSWAEKLSNALRHVDRPLH